MNADQVEGAVKKAAGQAQQAFGDLGGGVKHQIAGARAEVAGRAQETYGEAKQTAQRAASAAARIVEDQPLTSLLVVGAVAFALGLMVGRR
jgi:uncharacterized protein YjbJ (UPF0337 family)